MSRAVPLISRPEHDVKLHKHKKPDVTGLGVYLKKKGGDSVKYQMQSPWGTAAIERHWHSGRGIADAPFKSMSEIEPYEKWEWFDLQPDGTWKHMGSLKSDSFVDAMKELTEMFWGCENYHGTPEPSYPAADLVERQWDLTPLA